MKLNRIIFYIVFLMPAFTMAQVITKETVRGNAKEFYERGDNSYAFGKLEQADSLLRLAVQEKPTFIDAWLLIGQINLEYLNQYEKAFQAYQTVKTLQANYLSDVDFQLAKCHFNMSDYAQAKELLNTYLQTPKIPAQNKIMADKMLLDCGFAAEAIKHPLDFKPVNLGPGVNTSNDESMPSLTADEAYLYFTRHTGSGRYQDEDLYVSKNEHGIFSQANPISAINTENYVEGAQSISPSGKYLFFTSADRKDGEGRADIYMTRKTGETWERANNMGPPINSPGWDAQPCISSDGRTLYFASVRAGGQGGSDIYVSHYENKTGWSQPENLGESINIMFDEMRSFIHPDGQTLYFSSNGWPGMGNFDIFMSRKQADGTCGQPVNLGYPINTAGDELGIHITTDGSRAYYASEQKDSYGQKDLYSFELSSDFRPSFTSYIRGNVFDDESREPVSANIQIYDLETGNLYTTLSSDKVNGTFLSTLPAGKDYAVEVLKDGYLFYSHNISLKNVKGGKPFDVDIPLLKIKVGQVVVLNNIFFEPEKYELKPESKTEMGVMIKLLEKNPELKIEISGHTDNSGIEEKNKTLSQNRAKQVFEYLVSKGVEASRISYKGYASSRPIASNSTAEGKAKNRRTEFIVVAI
ncbi:MAG: PD40 domain-containing protein [Bacteroidetes bacterium]|nr:PD40 domain-containing protein [Bacteroidota bacterium]